MITMKRTKIADVLKDKSLLNTEVTVCGWVRNLREGKANIFIALNDGSSFDHLQLFVDRNLFDENAFTNISNGASLQATGKLTPSEGGGQSV